MLERLKNNPRYLQRTDDPMLEFIAVICRGICIRGNRHYRRENGVSMCHYYRGEEQDIQAAR